jgi:hypothetical protein
MPIEHIFDLHCELRQYLGYGCYPIVQHILEMIDTCHYDGK